MGTAGTGTGPVVRTYPVIPTTFFLWMCSHCIGKTTILPSWSVYPEVSSSCYPLEREGGREGRQLRGRTLILEQNVQGKKTKHFPFLALSPLSSPLSAMSTIQNSLLPVEGYGEKRRTPPSTAEILFCFFVVFVCFRIYTRQEESVGEAYLFFKPFFKTNFFSTKRIWS